MNTQTNEVKKHGDKMLFYRNGRLWGLYFMDKTEGLGARTIGSTIKSLLTAHYAADATMIRVNEFCQSLMIFDEWNELFLKQTTEIRYCGRKGIEKAIARKNLVATAEEFDGISGFFMMLQGLVEDFGKKHGLSVVMGLQGASKTLIASKMFNMFGEHIRRIEEYTGKLQIRLIVPFAKKGEVLWKASFEEALAIIMSRMNMDKTGQVMRKAMHRLVDMRLIAPLGNPWKQSEHEKFVANIDYKGDDIIAEAIAGNLVDKLTQIFLRIFGMLVTSSSYHFQPPSDEELGDDEHEEVLAEAEELMGEVGPEDHIQVSETQTEIPTELPEKLPIEESTTVLLMLPEGH